MQKSGVGVREPLSRLPLPRATAPPLPAPQLEATPSDRPGPASPTREGGDQARLQRRNMLEASGWAPGRC